MTAARPLERTTRGACAVREVSAGDLRTVVALARRMHAESAFAFLAFDVGSVTSGFEAVVGREDHFGAVAERGARVVGFIAGRLAHYPFSREILASDLAFYVAPEARASTAAVRLVRALWTWAESKGARELSLASSSGVEVERLEQFYGRLGLAKMGSIHRVRLH
ncbi:MAG TPA: GNAT family N-acetyltransferase [Byssovorax sp.]|jgi:GNAT superfamily N-acetyltransferase